MHNKSVRTRKRLPHLAELSVAADSDRIARGEKVANGGFHRAPPRRVNGQHGLLARPEHRLQQFEHLTQLVGKLGGTMVNHWPSACGQDALGNARRARRHQQHRLIAAIGRRLHSMIPCFLRVSSISPLNSTPPLISAMRFDSRSINAATSSSTWIASPAGMTATPSLSPTTMSPGQTTVPPQLIGTLISPGPSLSQAPGLTVRE